MVREVVVHVTRVSVNVVNKVNVVNMVVAHFMYFTNHLFNFF